MSEPAKRPIAVAVLGPGTVGSQVIRLLGEHADDLAARVGAPLVISGVLVRDSSVAREGIDAALLTSDAESLVAGADVVVELMGGIEPARSLILAALAEGKAVVTANKEIGRAHV